MRKSSDIVLEEQQNMQLHLVETQNAYNNLCHAVQTGGPLLEEDDEEYEQEEEKGQSSSIPNVNKTHQPSHLQLPYLHFSMLVRQERYQK